MIKVVDVKGIQESESRALKTDETEMWLWMKWRGKGKHECTHRGRKSSLGR